MTWQCNRRASSEQNIDVGPILGSSRQGETSVTFAKTYPMNAHGSVNSEATEAIGSPTTENHLGKADQIHCVWFKPGAA